jgi:hypothetical protein
MEAEPTEPVAKALAAHKRAETRAEQTRALLYMAIAEASDAGVRQADLVRVTGYTREHIRQIVKAAKEDG